MIKPSSILLTVVSGLSFQLSQAQNGTQNNQAPADSPDEYYDPRNYQNPAPVYPQDGQDAWYPVDCINWMNFYMNVYWPYPPYAYYHGPFYGPYYGGERRGYYGPRGYSPRGYYNSGRRGVYASGRGNGTASYYGSRHSSATRAGRPGTAQRASSATARGGFGHTGGSHAASS